MPENHFGEPVAPRYDDDSELFARGSKLNLMGRIAGPRLRERGAGPRREPFTAESTKHVSVWERASTS